MPRNGFSSFEGDADPLGLAQNEFVLVVGTHGAAEDDGTAVVLQRLGQGIAEARLAHVERMAVAAEPLADMAGVGLLLMQHDADGLLRRAPRTVRLGADRCR